jgi:hypothetical protein
MLVALTGGAASLLACAGDDATSADDVDLIGGAADESFPATLVIKENCTAAKVGPNHILFAAHCVEGEPGMLVPGGRIEIGSTLLEPAPSFDAGVTTRDASASREGGTFAADAGAGGRGVDASTGAPRDGGTGSWPDGGMNLGWDGGTSTSDGGASASGSDGGASPSAAPPIRWRTVTVDRIEIEPQRLATCRGSSSCVSILDPRGADSPDVVVVITKEPLDFVPATAKVDLDPVVPGDDVFVVGAGCEDYVWQRDFDYSRRRVKSAKTRALSPYDAFHPGSHMNQIGDRVSVATAYASSYFATPGPDWEAGSPGLCPGDSGGPVYRADAKNVIVGVNATYTFKNFRANRPLPTTNGHTRLDGTSRWTVGKWLESLGVETVRSCTTRSCTPYDAGVPTEFAGDAGSAASTYDAGAKRAPSDAGSSGDGG